jgi:hypothetical protein
MASKIAIFIENSILMNRELSGLSGVRKILMNFSPTYLTLKLKSFENGRKANE